MTTERINQIIHSVAIVALSIAIWFQSETIGLLQKEVLLLQERVLIVQRATLAFMEGSNGTSAENAIGEHVVRCTTDESQIDWYGCWVDKTGGLHWEKGHK